MNIYFKASVPETSLRQTTHVAKWAWFAKDEFMALEMHPSYDKTRLATVIFNE